MQQSLKAVIDQNLVNSAHDISEGGLLTALLESSFPNRLGFEVESDASIRKDAFLFGEAQGRVIVSVDEQKQAKLEEHLQQDGVPFFRLGKVTEGEVAVDDESFGKIDDWQNRYDNALEELLQG